MKPSCVFLLCPDLFFFWSRSKKYFLAIFRSEIFSSTPSWLNFHFYIFRLFHFSEISVHIFVHVEHYITSHRWALYVITPLNIIWHYTIKVDPKSGHEFWLFVSNFDGVSSYPWLRYGNDFFFFWVGNIVKWIIKLKKIFPHPVLVKNWSPGDA